MEPPVESTSPRPGDELYLDEKATRDELTREFSVCVECRRCADMCGAFPTLFAAVDARGGGPGDMSPHEQDQVVEACHQCNLCVVGCPYSPAVSELAVDVPRLMLRAKAMRRAAGQVPLRRRIAVSVAAAPVPRLLAGSAPGSLARRVAAAATGVSAARLLPPRAKQRFTTWFHARTDRPAQTEPDDAVRVSIVPTCHVEHHVPEVGRDLVELYERLGITCSVADVVCCGAPSLHSGDLPGFERIAERNVTRLADDIRAGAGAIVVPQPECAFVLAVDAPGVLRTSDADLVASHVRGACELVDELADHGRVELPAARHDGPDKAILHAPCRERARHAVPPDARLLERLGMAVEVVAGCSGTADTWGLRAEHETTALGMARSLADSIEGATVGAAEGPDEIAHAGGCALSNIAVTEQTGLSPVHPIQLVKRRLLGR